MRRHRAKVPSPEAPTSPPPTREDLDEIRARIANVEKDSELKAKRVAALEFSDKWRPKFLKLFASYEQVVLRIGGAIDAATEEFKTVQSNQAQAEALVLQVAGLLAGVTIAGGFGWAFTMGLGALGKDARFIEAILKRIESPGNTLASMSANVAGAQTSITSAQFGQAPQTRVSGRKISTALRFLSSNLEQLAAHREGIEGAFETRRKMLDKFTPEEWKSLNLAPHEAACQEVYDQLVAAYSPIDQLKSHEALVPVIERHLWASWMINQDAARYAGLVEFQKYAPKYSDVGIELKDDKGPEYHPELSLGGYVEDRLNKLGIATMADVKLSGHALMRNHPDDWEARLLMWANRYREGVNIDDAAS